MNATPTAQGPTRPGLRPGVTMAELLIVFVVIGLMTAVAMPRLGVAQRRADAAMQTLGMALTAAQRSAVSRQHDVRVSIDTAGGRFWIHEDANNDGDVDTGERRRAAQLDGAQFGRGAAPARPLSGLAASFTADANGFPTVTFQRNGSATEVGIVYLNGGLDSRSTRAVEVERGTGRVTWYRFGGSEWELGF